MTKLTMVKNCEVPFNDSRQQSIPPGELKERTQKIRVQRSRIGPRSIGRLFNQTSRRIDISDISRKFRKIQRNRLGYGNGLDTRARAARKRRFAPQYRIFKVSAVDYSVTGKRAVPCETDSRKRHRSPRVAYAIDSPSFQEIRARISSTNRPRTYIFPAILSPIDDLVYLSFIGKASCQTKIVDGNYSTAMIADRVRASDGKQELR